MAAADRASGRRLGGRPSSEAVVAAFGRLLSGSFSRYGMSAPMRRTRRFCCAPPPLTKPQCSRGGAAMNSRNTLGCIRANRQACERLRDSALTSDYVWQQLGHDPKPSGRGRQPTRWRRDGARIEPCGQQLLVRGRCSLIHAVSTQRETAKLLKRGGELCGCFAVSLFSGVAISN